MLQYLDFLLFRFKLPKRLSKISPTYETRSVVKILALIFSKQNIFEKIPKNSHNNSFLTMYDTIG